MSENLPVETEESPIPLEFPKVCFACKEKNLVQSIQEYLRDCPRCGTCYCVHFASGIDPVYCKDCCKEVEMTEQELSVTREKYNEKTDQITTRVHRYRSIKFCGLDWLFFQRKITEMSDQELSLAIEYHQALYRGMLDERDRRRIEHFHRNAGKKVVIKTAEGINLNDATTIETTVKKTRVTKAKAKTSAEVNIASGLQSLLKSGMSHEQILAAIRKVK